MEEKVEKILKLIYVIFVLVLINTVILVTSNLKITIGDSNKESETTSEENQDYDVSMFEKVDFDKMMDKFESSDLEVIYIGRPTCGYCVKFLPVLQEAQKKFGYKTVYYDLTDVTQDETNKIIEKDNEDEFIKTNFGATPMVLLVKDGKLVDGWVGYSEYDSFAEFLTKNGLKD